MWGRRRWLRAVASAGLAGLPLARAQTRLAPPEPARLPRASLGRVVVAVEHKASFCYLPLTIAERQGFFSAEGLDVQVRDFAQAGQSLQALLGGGAHLVSVPYSQIISLQMRGHDLQSIVLQGRTPQLVLGVSRASLGHFRHVEDLRGKRLAVTGLGEGSHHLVRGLLARSGVAPQEVRIEVFGGPAATAAAFRAGQVDALCYDDPLITQLEQGGDLRVVVDTRTVRGSQDVFGGPMPAGCLAAPLAWVDEHPRISQALANGMVQALKWLQTAGPSDLNKTVPEPYFMGDRALYLAAFSRARESWTPDGLMPEAGPMTAVRALARFDDPQQLQKVVLGRTFTNGFARQAKERFRA
ncbi:MAG: ABC transporter substrate-binding protein [Hydrogenophaga sp.]